MKIGQNLLQRLTNLSSVSQINGKPLSAVEQVLYRMQQEAAQDLSKTVKLTHFVVSLATIPNGPAKFKMSDLLRTVGIDEYALRQKFNLPTFDSSFGVSSEVPLSESVGLILHEAKKGSQPQVDSLEKISSTRVLYNSLITYFSSGNSLEHGEHIFLQSIQDRSIIEIN